MPRLLRSTERRSHSLDDLQRPLPYGALLLRPRRPSERGVQLRHEGGADDLHCVRIHCDRERAHRHGHAWTPSPPEELTQIIEAVTSGCSRYRVVEEVLEDRCKCGRHRGLHQADDVRCVLVLDAVRPIVLDAVVELVRPGND